MQPLPAPTIGAATAGEAGAMRRLQLLCDDGSLQVIRSAGAEGVVAATGRVRGRRVACYAQDVRVGGGSVGAAHAESILRVLRTARRSRVPVIGFVESGGARMQEASTASRATAGSSPRTSRSPATCRRSR